MGDKTRVIAIVFSPSADTAVWLFIYLINNWEMIDVKF
jgi:hypothetical protein